MKLKINYNNADFLSDFEVVLQIPKNAELSYIETGLLTIPEKPILFGATHPEGGFKDKNLETVFSQGIKLAGTMGDVWIDCSGRPKLKAKINITGPDIKALINQGKVLLSYVYWGDQSSSLSSSFDFDHLLIYPWK